MLPLAAASLCSAFFLLSIASAASSSFGVAPEPWLPLHGGGFTGPRVPSSPDPLVSYVWRDIPSINDTLLQIFPVAPVSCGALPGTPSSSFSNASACAGALFPRITVTGAGTLVVDFGVELPAWLEFDSADLLPGDASALVLGTGEYNRVDYSIGYKRGPPTVYPSPSACNGAAPCTYRLETNPELYEGVRYGFITLAAPPSHPFTITGLRAVSQAKPVNYVGAFSSAGDPILTQTWYTAAYTVRAALQADYIGSILEDRGDRMSWTGDAHVAQIASLAAFGNARFVLENLNRTSCVNCCNGIATYCLYFVLSALDYVRETGDAAALAYFGPAISAKLEHAWALFPNPRGLRFVGHDDRLGNGFANNTNPETQALYRFLAIRCWSGYAAALAAAGNATGAAHWANYSAAGAAAVRGGGAWWAPLGLHAGADAINAGFATPAEVASIADAVLSDIVVVPSQSNFNQYFILQALAGAGLLDRAVEVVRAVWGPILALGATTFWEISYPDWGRILAPGPPPIPNEAGWASLCHPWSAGAAPWLTKWVLGVRPAGAGGGYARVVVAPHVAHGMAGVEGAAPVPHSHSSGGAGAVEVAVAARARGVVEVALALPRGVAAAELRLTSVTLARLGLAGALEHGAVEAEGPAGSWARVAHAVTVPEDSPLEDEAVGAAAGGTLRPRAPALVVQVPSDNGVVTRHRFRVRIVGGGGGAGAAPLRPLPAPRAGSPFPPPSWPGAILPADFATRGSWQGVYGKDGYVMFGAGPGGGDAVALPPWVHSLTLWGASAGFSGRTLQWTNASGDPRALAQPGGGRALGAAAPQGSGSIPIDVFVNDDAPPRFRVAAYFTDFGPTPWGDGESGENRTQEVYLLTGYPALNPLTPHQLLADFAPGVWLNYEVGGNFRVRVTTVRGDYCVLSALMFDSVR
jgi:hypothetical protein